MATNRKARTRYSVPYHCPECYDTDKFYGILRFPEDIEKGEQIACPNHKTVDEDGNTQDRFVPLVPATGGIRG